MPKPTSRKRAAEAEEYDSDGGFVEDAPKSKKSKPSTVNGKTPAESGKDDDGNEYWEISRARRVTVSEFRGKYMLSIREYYEKDGNMLPGKKGISLPLDQFNAFIEVLPEVESALRAKGQTIPRPKYDGAKTEELDDEPGQDDTGNAVEELEQEPIDGVNTAEPIDRKGKLDKFKMKPNHEATSDEDEA